MTTTTETRLIESKYGRGIGAPAPVSTLVNMLGQWDKEGFKLMSVKLCQPLNAAAVAVKNEQDEIAWLKELGITADNENWLMSGDTGTSSLTIYSVMTGHASDRHDVPYDPADFGRCYRLLKRHPEFRSRMGEVADKYPKWQGLVDAWSELTALYEEELPSGKAPKLYARIQTLIK